MPKVKMLVIMAACCTAIGGMGLASAASAASAYRLQQQDYRVPHKAGHEAYRAYGGEAPAPATKMWPGVPGVAGPLAITPGESIYVAPRGGREY